MASSGDYRALLRGGLWLAVVAATLSVLYGLAENSPIALALGLDYVLVAVTVWAAGNLHFKRDFKPSAGTIEPSGEALRLAVQMQSAVVGGAAALVGLIVAIQLLQQALGVGFRENAAAHFGAACLAGAFVWLVLARSLDSISAAELPEARPLAFAFREAKWMSLLAAAGVIGTTVFPEVALWINRILLVWIL